MTPPILRANIPTEIHLTIADYLPLSSRVALTLTCKRLLEEVYGTKNWKLLRDKSDKGRERAEFLLLLERDLVDYYHRSFGETSLKKRLPASTPQNYIKNSPDHYQDEHAYLVLLEHFQYAISWPHLVLALKRDKYGSGHGLSLDTFKYNGTRTFVSDGTPVRPYTVDLDIEPRIVNARLLLRCTYQIRHAPSWEVIDLSELLDIKLSLCKHISTQARREPGYDDALSLYLAAWHNIVEDSWAGEDMDKFLTSSHLLMPEWMRGHCRFCMTDWNVATAPNDDSILVTTWQNLGTGNSRQPVRDPLNTVWSVFTGELYAYNLVYHPGCVEEAFESRRGEPNCSFYC